MSRLKLIYYISHIGMNLILDITRYIASFDEKAWYKLYRTNDEFRMYAKSKYGINEYVSLFLERVLDGDMKKHCYLVAFIL